MGASAVRAAGFAYPFLSYRLSELHFPARGVSGVLAAFGVGWLVGQLVCGRLAATLGRRTTLVSALLVSAAVLPLLAQATAPVAVGAAAVIAGMCYDAPRPVISAFVADEITDEATRARITGWRHFGINVGAATTGAVGGLLADSAGLSALFWINAVACAVFAVVVLAVLPGDRPAPGPVDLAAGPVRDGRLWLLWLASVLGFVPVAGVFNILPLLMEHSGLPASAYGWTQVASAATVLLLSVPATDWLARRPGSSSMVGLLAASSLVLGTGIGCAGLASSTLQYAAAAAAAVPGEITAIVAAQAVVDRITPPQARGLYAGVWGTSLATAVICAPVLAGFSLAQGGPGLVAVTTFSCGALGAVTCLPLAVLVNRHRTRPLSPTTPR
ncbi:MFS transporter [Streptomyces sp. NPDC006476]|uniref:MFS transporter n=1 Tax=Streptomyces sp. NPDC006476 TaxID=3157175 RepID=UPI0033B4AE91